MGVSVGHVSAGAVQAENPSGPQYWLTQRPKGAAADRRQEGKVDPGLEGDPRAFHKG